MKVNVKYKSESSIFFGQSNIVCKKTDSDSIIIEKARRKLRKKRYLDDMPKDLVFEVNKTY